MRKNILQIIVYVYVSCRKFHSIDERITGPINKQRWSCCCCDTNNRTSNKFNVWMSKVNWSMRIARKVLNNDLVFFSLFNYKNFQFVSTVQIVCAEHFLCVLLWIFIKYHFSGLTLQLGHIGIDNKPVTRSLSVCVCLYSSPISRLW